MKINKTHIFLLFVFLCMHTSGAMTQTVSVKGKVTNSGHSRIYVNVPVDGNYFAGANLEFPIQQDGSFSFEVSEIDKPGLMTLSNGFSYFFLFVQPGGHYELNCDKSACTFSGTESEGQNALRKLPVFNDPKMLFRNIDSVENVHLRKETVENKYQSLKQPFDTLFKNAQITPQFHQWVSRQIDFAAKNWMATGLFFKFRSVERGELSKTEFMNESFPVWAGLFKNLNQDKAMRESIFSDYFLDRYKSFLDVQTDGRLNFKDGVFEERVLASGLLSGTALEYARAGHIVNGISQNRFEEKWIEEYDNFRSQFPESKLTKWMAPYVEKVAVYHENAKNDHSEVIFVEEAANFNSLSELLSSLKGHYSYVDVWATWCGPCREELQYSKDLHDQIRAMGIQTVYLSVDSEKDADKWRQMVKSLQLRGINMRANETLHNELRNNLPRFVGIPHYFIVDKTGNIIVGRAQRPSSQNLLIEQLKSIIE